MGIRTRRAGMPVQTARDMGLTRKDKVLAWAHLVGDSVAAATTTRLLILNPQGTLSTAAWTDIRQAVWDRDSQTLGVWLIGIRHPLGLEMAAGSLLPDVVQEQVHSSVVISRTVDLPDGAVAVVAVRRRAGGDLVIQTLWPDSMADVEARDPVAVRAVEATVNDLREEVGMTCEVDGQRARAHSRFGIAASL